MKLKGIFKITNWSESTNKSFNDGSKLTNVHVEQNYDGDITGNSYVKFQMIYMPNGLSIFNGFECFVGTLAEKKCELTIKHDGKFEAGLASSQLEIIHSTTHPKLKGAQGFFTSAEDGKASFEIG